MVFDKWQIKSISAVTNYNSSSCLLQNSMFKISINPIIIKFFGIGFQEGYKNLDANCYKDIDQNTV